MTDKTTPLRPGSPCVAVVMPAYNAEQTIAAALRPALAEPEVAELVVDGATDHKLKGRARASRPRARPHPQRISVRCSAAGCGRGR